MKYLFIFLFVFPLISYSQPNNDKQIVGKTYTRVGSRAYSANVIFHRNKQALIVMQTAGDSLQGILKFVERERSKLGKGVEASYERITYHKLGTKKIELDVSPYNQKDFAAKSNINQEIDKLKSVKFVSGTIYFSGYGFTNVIAAKASEKAKLEIYYHKSQPGTTITLENCVYQNSNGTLSAPLNKSIKLN